MSKIKVLIIGGTGCISSALVQECLSSQIDVTIVNRGRRKLPMNVKSIKADKKDFKTIQESIKGITFDAIIDFLCFTKEDLQNSFQFYSNYAKQYFFISSCAVYDLRNNKIGKEDGPKVDERWNYSINKWKAEQELRKLAIAANKIYTIVRPSVTYGDTRIPYGITPVYGKHGTILQRILNNKPIIRWNGGTNVCNMMRVEDFSRAFVKLIGNEKAFNTEFNICSEKVYSYNDVLDIIENKIRKKIETFDITSQQYAKLLPNRKGEILVDRGSNRISSFSKFKSLFPDFKEEYDLEKGISKTIDAYISQNWMSGISWEFDGECDRIIHKICGKKNNMKYNIRFIDYLNNATEHDRKEYYESFNKFRIDRRIIELFLRIRFKIQRIIKQ